MRATQFDLVTEWHMSEPIERVWRALSEPEKWPQWWPSVKRVDLIEPGGADGVGAVRRISWTTALPYDLTFDMKTTRIEEHSLIEGQASGELDGTGRWTFRREDPGCRLRYDWSVRVTKPWMILLSPLIRPVFAWNHNVVMERGRKGLQSYLQDRRDSQ